MVSIKLSGKTPGIDKTIRKLIPAAQRKASVGVGFSEGATYPDGTTVAEVAAFNEYGTKNQPPRPFFRIAIANRSEAWGKNLGTALKRTNYNAPLALAMIGLGMKEDVQDSIRDLVSPPLAPSTVARKGFEKPLISTSTMLNSVTVKVDTE